MTVCLVGLLLSIAMHEFTTIDFALQDRFYDATAGRWWVDADAPLLRAVFYLVPKWLTISTVVTLGGWVVVDRGLGIHDSPAARARWMLLLCLIAIPAVVGLIKKFSGVWTPADLTRYGGEHAFRLLFDARPAGTEVGQHFPGGHASAGFAFLGLCFLPVSDRRRAAFFILAMGLGWSMGLYQMLKGAHFLSHTLATMFLAGLIAGVVSWCVPLVRSTPADSAAPIGRVVGDAVATAERE